MSELVTEKLFPAEDGVFYTVMGVITDTFREAGCCQRHLMQLEIAAEEIFVNIAHYAYPPQAKGKLRLRLFIEEGPMAVVEFADWGVPFDPLAKPDADITLSAEERRIGGLGILMVKRSMDAVSYVRKDGMNIFTMKKKFS